MALLGIDLGTTNTVASVNRNVVPLRPNGAVTMPSTVAFLPNGEVRVGEVARRRRAIDSINTVFSSKRIIGRRYDDSQTRNFITRYPFHVIEREDGWPAFRTRAGEFTPTEIATQILQELQSRLEIDAADCEVVITVPASFTEQQRDATLQAAAAAGLSHSRLVDEPSATVLAYLQRDQAGDRALVYDLGGGTFDCAVLDCTERMPRVLAHAGDPMLGGDDIDHQLAAWVARHVLEKYNWDLANYSETYDRLLAQCELAKIDLSEAAETALPLSQIDPECPAPENEVPLTRAVLEELCQDLVRRSFIACDDLLRMAGIRPPDIDIVYLAGGTVNLPVIREGVAAYFGRAGLTDIDPTSVVAMGAGHAAG
ncbi:MAG: Hsp70 family protein [Proteobacteria bacterium]|nr:Hsp70 family protein [Pseudomonadota bacterium]